MRTFRLMVVSVILVFISTKTLAQEKSKPLQYVLLFDWREDAETSKKEEILNLFRGFVGKVDGFDAVTIETLKKSSENFDIVLILEFATEEALKAYKVHPDHITISKTAPSLPVSYSVFDFYGSF